jgi:fatty acid desaturase
MHGRPRQRAGLSRLTETTAARLSTVAVVPFTILNALLFAGPPLLADHSAIWGLLWLIAMLTTQSYWALIHEAMHGHLGKTHGASFRYGRLLCWFFPAPFRALRTGHLVHHAFNRSETDRSEVYDPARTSRWRASVLYFLRLVIGLYLAEVALAVLSWAPRTALSALIARYARANGAAGEALRHAIKRQLLASAPLRELRIDGLVIIAILTTALWLHGPHAPVLLALLLARGVILSFSDNAFHYGTALNDRHAALNLAVAPWYSACVLHFNLHAVHHRHPHLPWWKLPQAFVSVGGRFDETWWRQAIRQLRGPIPVVSSAPVLPSRART